MSYVTFKIENGSVIFGNSADNKATIEARKAEDEFKEWEYCEAIGDTPILEEMEESFGDMW